MSSSSSDTGLTRSVLRTAPFNVGDFVVDVIPVNFGYSVNGDDVYTKLRREETMKGLEILKAQLARKHREYALNAVSDITRRIVDLASGIELKRRTHDLDGKLDALKEILRLPRPRRHQREGDNAPQADSPGQGQREGGSHGEALRNQEPKEAVEKALTRPPPKFWRKEWKSFYANAFTIGIADGNVLMVFELHVQGREAAEKCVVMSPAGFKTLIKSAEKEIEAFEKEQGKIPEWA